MTDKTHTVLGLYVLILLIRLWSSGRLSKAWGTLGFTGTTPTATGTSGKTVESPAPLPNPTVPL